MCQVEPTEWVYVIIYFVSPIFKQWKRAVIIFIEVSLHMNKQNNILVSIPTLIKVLFLNFIDDELDETQMLFIAIIICLNYKDF
jgi:hypothetical protein